MVRRPHSTEMAVPALDWEGFCRTSHNNFEWGVREHEDFDRAFTRACKAVGAGVGVARHTPTAVYVRRHATDGDSKRLRYSQTKWTLVFEHLLQKRRRWRSSVASLEGDVPECLVRACTTLAPATPMRHWFPNACDAAASTVDSATSVLDAVFPLGRYRALPGRRVRRRQEDATRLGADDAGALSDEEDHVKSFTALIDAHLAGDGMGLVNRCFERTLVAFAYAHRACPDNPLGEYVRAWNEADRGRFEGGHGAAMAALAACSLREAAQQYHRAVWGAASGSRNQLVGALARITHVRTMSEMLAAYPDECLPAPRGTTPAYRYYAFARDGVGARGRRRELASPLNVEATLHVYKRARYISGGAHLALVTVTHVYVAMSAEDMHTLQRAIVPRVCSHMGAGGTAYRRHPAPLYPVHVYNYWQSADRAHVRSACISLLRTFTYDVGGLTANVAHCRLFAPLLHRIMCAWYTRTWDAREPACARFMWRVLATPYHGAGVDPTFSLRLLDRETATTPALRNGVPSLYMFCATFLCPRPTMHIGVPETFALLASLSGVDVARGGRAAYTRFSAVYPRACVVLEAVRAYVCSLDATPATVNVREAHAFHVARDEEAARRWRGADADDANPMLFYVYEALCDTAVFTSHELVRQFALSVTPYEYCFLGQRRNASSVAQRTNSFRLGAPMRNRACVERVAHTASAAVPPAIDTFALLYRTLEHLSYYAITTSHVEVAAEPQTHANHARRRSSIQGGGKRRKASRGWHTPSTPPATPTTMRAPAAGAQTTRAKHLRPGTRGWTHTHVPAPLLGAALCHLADDAAVDAYEIDAGTRLDTAFPMIRTPYGDASAQSSPFHACHPDLLYALLYWRAR